MIHGNCHRRPDGRSIGPLGDHCGLSVEALDHGIRDSPVGSEPVQARHDASATCGRLSFVGSSWERMVLAHQGPEGGRPSTSTRSSRGEGDVMPWWAWQLGWRLDVVEPHGLETESREAGPAHRRRISAASRVNASSCAGGRRHCAPRAASAAARRWGLAGSSSIRSSKPQGSTRRCAVSRVGRVCPASYPGNGGLRQGRASREIALRHPRLEPRFRIRALIIIISPHDTGSGMTGPRRPRGPRSGARWAGSEVGDPATRSRRAWCRVRRPARD